MGVVRSHRGYDLLAPVYDILVTLIFGNSLFNAQKKFLYKLSAHQKVLIVGGGRGEILKIIDQLTIPLEITYLDVSEKMIKYASRLTLSNLTIRYQVGPIQDFKSDEKYDVLITSFFLDQFEGRVLNEITYTLSVLLGQGGQWLLTDFQRTGKIRHLLLEKVMYLFFKFFTGISAGKLSDYPGAVASTGMTLVDSRQFNHGFIKSWLFSRK